MRHTLREKFRLAEAEEEASWASETDDGARAEVRRRRSKGDGTRQYGQPHEPWV